MDFLRAAVAITRKDLRIEVRAKEIAYAMVFFAALVVLLFAFAFTREGTNDPFAAAGVVWIAVALSGTLGLSRAFDRERESDTLHALLMSPVPRTAIYVGKLGAIVVLMLFTELFATLFAALLFSAPLVASGARLPLLCLLVLGTVGYAAVGTLFAGMLARGRGRDVLLSILLYPIIVPVLMAGTRGTEALLASPMDLETAWFWARLLAVFDAVFVTVALWVFEPLVGAE